MKNPAKTALDILAALALAMFAAFLASYAVAILAVMYGLSYQAWGAIGVVVTSAVFVFVMSYRLTPLLRKRKKRT